jgi:hypothetical protein
MAGSSSFPMRLITDFGFYFSFSYMNYWPAFKLLLFSADFIIVTWLYTVVAWSTTSQTFRFSSVANFRCVSWWSWAFISSSHVCFRSHITAELVQCSILLALGVSIWCFTFMHVGTSCISLHPGTKTRKLIRDASFFLRFSRHCILWCISSPCSSLCKFWSFQGE